MLRPDKNFTLFGENVKGETLVIFCGGSNCPGVVSRLSVFFDAHVHFRIERPTKVE
jgi:hypothetical protein